jgi:hypothetical protein
MHVAQTPGPEIAACVHTDVPSYNGGITSDRCYGLLSCTIDKTRFARTLRNVDLRWPRPRDLSDGITAFRVIIDTRESGRVFVYNIQQAVYSSETRAGGVIARGSKKSGASESHFIGRHFSKCSMHHLHISVLMCPFPTSI